jgi:thiol-disulfide isomerase/thioredoxin
VKTIVAVILACWSVASVAQVNSSSPAAADASIAANAGNHRFNLAKGATLPDFVYTDFNGTPHRFSDIHAKYRLIDFWATWCLPCVADLASKKAAYEKYHPRGLEILGIDDQEREPNAAQKLISKSALPWPQARFDRSLVYGQFAVYQLPTFVLVDSNNVIVSVTTNSSGELAGHALSHLLSKLLPPTN